jgi:predicted metal-dependent phosphoesterase TrpH
MTTPTWKIELHSHTIYSKDSLTRIGDLQEICRKRGIDKIAITDHNNAQGALAAARLYPMLFIPGEEVMTTKGELLAWYITEEVPPELSPEETIKQLRDQGAVIGVAHPFDRYRSGAWKLDDLLEIVDLVDAIEVFNSRCIHNEDNLKALELAQANGKLMTCGSDAHIRREYGTSLMVVPPFANNAEEFRKALKNGTRQEALSGFLVHFGSTYAKWLKRFRPSLKPT